MFSHARKRSGFTLLELLMVVIIIAILASIALPQYLRTAERSRASEALTNLAAVRSSELRLKAQTGAYTKDLSAATTLDIDIPQLGTGGAPGSANWDFTVDGTGAGSNAIATRRNAGAATIQIDLDNGTSCSSDTQYGLPTPANC